ncbi:MAG: T9SS type A sorting domain-containing protein [Candidatus Micrarchaeota archaeon]
MSGPLIMKKKREGHILENVQCEFGLFKNHTLELADGKSVKANFLKFSLGKQNLLMEMSGEKTSEVWYNWGSMKYYYFSGQAGGMVAAPFESSFRIGESGISGFLFCGQNPKNVGHSMGMIGLNKKNLSVEGVWTSTVVIATIEETINDRNGKVVTNKVGDIWYKDVDNYYKKAKMPAEVYYSENATSVDEIGKPVKINPKYGVMGPTIVKMFPNPADAEASLEFVVPKNDVVSIRVYNVVGQEVITPMDKAEVGEGRYNVNIKTSHLSPGNYYVKIHNEEGHLQTARLVVMH